MVYMDREYCYYGVVFMVSESYHSFVCLSTLALAPRPTCATNQLGVRGHDGLQREALTRLVDVCAPHRSVVSSTQRVGEFGIRVGTCVRGPFWRAAGRWAGKNGAAGG